MLSTEAAIARPEPSRRVTFASRAAGLLANEWAVAGVIFLVTRAVALAGAYAGVVQVTTSEPFRNKGWLAELALMWDATWYVGIAQESYQYDPNAAGGTNVAFAPLYPFLVRSLSELLKLLTFGWDWGNAQYGSLIAAGLIISNVSFFVALALLIRLLEPRLGKVGAATVAFALASLPLSFFFSALYTEGLFLLLVVSSLLVARSDWRWKWLCAGMLGMLAVLDRFAGALLVPVLAVEYLSQRDWRWRSVRLDLLWLSLAPLGMALYLGFLWWKFGSPFVLNDSMLKGWNHQASFFLATYWNSAAQLWQSITGAVPADQDPVLYYGQGNRLYLILDLGIPLLLLLGAFLARKKVLASEWTWLVLGIVYPLSANITFSLARYVLPLWPGLIWLGTLRKPVRWLLVPWIVFSLTLLAWSSYIYGSARWIG